MIRRIRPLTRAMWDWTDDHTFASGVMVAAPTITVLVAWHEHADRFSTTLAIAAGLCWTGVLLPSAIRQTMVLVSGGVAATCGALVSIIFSETMDMPGQVDPAFSLFFGLLAAGSASLYGQHRNVAQQRPAERGLIAVLERVEPRQYRHLSTLRR